MQSSLIKPDLKKVYPQISYGKGVFLYDTEGTEYLDACSGAVTANIGHGVPEIAEAMARQAGKISFVYRSQFTSGPAEKLADKMSAITGGKLNWSFFVSSGSEAAETALKIAVQYWQEKGKPRKNRIISRHMSYHGITMGALSMSGHPVRRERFSVFLDACPAVPAPYCYRCPLGLSPGTCGLACAKELEHAILRTGPENTAAFIAEPVVGAAGGAISPPDGYYQELMRICRQYDILFIADEVMTGLGRTGEWLASSHWGLEPDIAVFGKGMSGGYTPIAAAAMTDAVMEPFLSGSGSIMAGHTYSANPLSCAISLAVLEYIEKNGLIEKAREAGNRLNELLQKIAADFPFIGEVRGKGLLMGLEFVQSQETKNPFPPEANVTGAVIQIAMEHGLLLYPAAAGTEGVTGSAILIAPPMTVSTGELNLLERKLRAVCQVLYNQLADKGFIGGKGVQDGSQDQ